MRHRILGKTGLKVSEIGFGGEWLERHEAAESVELLKYAHQQGINIVDCWMPDPKSRDIIGKAMEGMIYYFMVPLFQHLPIIARKSAYSFEINQ